MVRMDRIIAIIERAFEDLTAELASVFMPYKTAFLYFPDRVMAMTERIRLTMLTVSMESINAMIGRVFGYFFSVTVLSGAG